MRRVEVSPKCFFLPPLNDLKRVNDVNKWREQFANHVLFFQRVEISPEIIMSTAFGVANPKSSDIRLVFT